MGARSDKEPLTSPRNFFPGRKRSVAELFPKFLGRSFLAFSHFAAVDHHIVSIAFSLDLDLAKFHQSCLHISMFRWLRRASRQDTRTPRIASSAESPLLVPQTPSLFRPNAQRNASRRRGARRHQILIIARCFRQC